MEGVKMAQYTEQFMIQVAKAGLKARTYAEVAKQYGVSRQIVRKWTKLYGEYGDLAFEPKGPEKCKDKEIAELKRKVADLEEENEILKKATAYFSKGDR
jgi:transposase